jgi:mycothiol synthase
MTTELEPMQLRMLIGGAALRAVRILPPAEGYTLRHYRPGDEEGILRALNAVGFGWSRERLEEYLTQPERKEGTHVAVHGEQIVAVTFATREAEALGRVDFVAADPAHSGRGLGMAVVSAVLRYLADRGYPEAMLTTDDWRLPAIRTYLNLGFRPDYCREDMPARWERVCADLGWPWKEVRPEECST